MKQLGFSFIELLLALILFSCVLLAAFSMQIKSGRQAEASELQVFAAGQIDYAVAALKAGQHNLLGPWQKRVANQLPQGKASLIDQAGHKLIKISWFDPVSDKQISLTYSF
jgi:Tfp pilus assembly protein PilV